MFVYIYMFVHVFVCINVCVCVYFRVYVFACLSNDVVCVCDRVCVHMIDA